MTSRMERYYKPTTNYSSKRSERNECLYREIYDVGEYSNIEGIATIEKSNEVDITKIKNMLKNREQYQKQREIRHIVERPRQAIKEEIEILETEKNYDIRDVLNKAKVNKPTDEYHRLEDTGYNILRRLKEKSLNDEEDKGDLRELIDTITNNSKLNQLADKDLSLDMFDDLKSYNNTTIDNKESIKALLDEAKEVEKKKEKDKMEMDKSFYTSSLNFRDEDFETISNMNKNVKRNSLLIRIAFFTTLVLITTGVIIFIYNIIK